MEITGMLKSIYIVTILVLSALGSEKAYEQNLAYTVEQRGEISGQLAKAWEMPQIEGSPYVLMRPDSNEQVYLRFIQAETRGNYEPMKTLGWNAIEILVQDPDALAKSLDKSQFEIIGAPAFLTEQQNIRAMQALGPDQEVLYLTRVIDPAASNFNLVSATSYVDRVFIMVLGTGDIGATSAWYSEWLGQEIGGPWPYQVSVLSTAWNKPVDTVYDLSLAQLQESFLIEIDEYPASAVKRSPTLTGLPFGPAMVSFKVDSLASVAEKLGKQPQKITAAPYSGQSVLLIQGPSGEWIELVGPQSEADSLQLGQ